ncbi:MAG TPA: DUF4178 domain-containing protein [Anaerolineae bacterium]
MEIAQQIPDYAGYQEKERRRDANELVRRQLAAKYDEQRTHLARLQRQAPLDSIVALENLDQKLLRLIARFRTATGGYAGWFDAAQIVESDLDQLTQFDSSLAAGVDELSKKIDALAAAQKSKTGLDDAVADCADTLDALNAQYDLREQFVSLGKKPSPAQQISRPLASPLGALETTKAPPKELVNLAGLKVNDAISFENADYIVTGKITYSVSAGSFWAYLLQDGPAKSWLRVGPGGETAICQETKISVPSPSPESLQQGGKLFTQTDLGTATVQVEGVGGVKRGSVSYARYGDNGDARLWIEDYGTETRVMTGHIVDPGEVTAYRK